MTRGTGGGQPPPSPPVAIGGRATSAAIAELARRDAWVCWRYCADRRTGMPEAELARVLRTYPQIRRIATERQYSSASERDLALCRIGKLFGWPPERAWALVLATRTDGKAERPDYASLTLSRVY